MTDPFAVLRGREVPPPPDEDDTSSVEAFVEYAMAVGRKDFLPGWAQAIARATGATLRDTMAALRGYGLEPSMNTVRTVRGFNSWDHNLWAGNPGAGGGGQESLTGFAGPEGMGSKALRDCLRKAGR